MSCFHFFKRLVDLVKPKHNKVNKSFEHQPCKQPYNQLGRQLEDQLEEQLEKKPEKPPVKKRLYIALYPSASKSQERRYHWSFLIGPADESEEQVAGVRFHVKNHPTEGWIFEETHLDNIKTTYNLLARLIIADVVDEDRLVEILRHTPLRDGEPGSRCRTWMSDVLDRIAHADPKVVGACKLNWGEIEPLAILYVDGKVEKGRYSQVELGSEPRPTWDMMLQREVIE